MGGVKDRYLNHASASDQYVGCCANCADQNSAKFHVSPPHFDFYSFEMADNIARNKELYMFIFDRLYQLTEDADDGHVKYIAKILFSFLCHHHKYLAENLHPQSFLINYTFFHNVPDRIRKCVKFPTHGTRQGKLCNLLVCLRMCY